MYHSHRPLLHFSPKRHWINDPNGMFFLNGTYHLYFQYHPYDTVWGPMHWGHATSIDLINWIEHPIALSPDDKGYIFSGCVVVDHHNTSGFGSLNQIPVVAIFTYHDAVAEARGDTHYQSQALAYSLDGGFTFTKYKENPILENPRLKDFRDPKVIWDDTRSNWLMVLSTYGETLFYTSENLKDWNYQSNFGKDLGAHDGVWECPDIFPIQVENTSETKWVLLQSLNPGGPNGGSGTQYFIGDFDGKQFLLDATCQAQLSQYGALWLDFGRDNYASVSWSNISKHDGRRIILGWMSNWDYANQTPTDGWRGKMTIPRVLTLGLRDDEYSIRALPSEEVIRNMSKAYTRSNVIVSDKFQMTIDRSENLNVSILIIDIDHITLGDYKVSLSNSKNEHLHFGLNTIDAYYYIDRQKSGLTSFSNVFANTMSKAILKKKLGSLQLSVLIDHGSVEIFFNNGETVMTEIVFNTQPFDTVSISNASKKDILIKQLELRTIKNKISI
ncbi:glycoside hydrolase family 32 protein [Psychroserpens sp.]|uniref:glycoside hydrolase family 32 protein n=1 Tax=Psychroserpens sp. TaxID=2020870 RepID=UPI003C783878